MYNTITPERFVFISFALVVVLIAGAVCAGLSQENKHLKEKQEITNMLPVKQKIFRLVIGGEAYLVELDNLLDDVYDFKVILDELPSKKIREKLISFIQLMCDRHGTVKFSLRKKKDHVGFVNSRLCTELERMFGN